MLQLSFGNNHQDIARGLGGCCFSVVPIEIKQMVCRGMKFHKAIYIGSSLTVVGFGRDRKTDTSCFVPILISVQMEHILP